MTVLLTSEPFFIFYFICIRNIIFLISEYSGLFLLLLLSFCKCLTSFESFFLAYCNFQKLLLDKIFISLIILSYLEM